MAEFHLNFEFYSLSSSNIWTKRLLVQIHFKLKDFWTGGNWTNGFWANGVWTKNLLGQCRVDQNSIGLKKFGLNIFWIRGRLDQTSFGPGRPYRKDSKEIERVS